MGLRGVFGGTFDPVHLGHLRCAWELAEALQGPVHMIPCRQPVHREGPEASEADRLALLERALDGQQRLLADDRELRRGGPSYMIDTLIDLAGEFPSDRLCLAVGEDAFLAIDRWHRWRELFEQAHVIVLARPGEHRRQGDALLRFLEGRWRTSIEALASAAPGLVLRLEVTALDISATEIRRLLAAGREPHYLVPGPVLDEIRSRKLYRR